MRNATSGSSLPIASYTWLIAGQAIAAGANLSSAAIPCNGAKLGDMVYAAARDAALPQTAAGSTATLSAWVVSNGNVILVISNPAAAALVATAADIVVDLMVFPRSP